MLIHRDITKRLIATQSAIQILIGPRQCGKSTLFAYISDTTTQEITFDDFQMRELANRDPALFMAQFSPPLLLDEVQYVPGIFSELKKVVDQAKKERLLGRSPQNLPVLYRLTGSNQILLDKQVKESLAGRASYFYLNTLTVHEILTALPQTNINDILFKGGWPEIYIEPQLSVVQYLNDYIRSYMLIPFFSPSYSSSSRQLIPLNTAHAFQCFSPTHNVPFAN